MLVGAFVNNQSPYSPTTLPPLALHTPLYHVYAGSGEVVCVTCAELMEMNTVEMSSCNIASPKIPAETKRSTTLNVVFDLHAVILTRDASLEGNDL